MTPMRGVFGAVRVFPLDKTQQFRSNVDEDIIVRVCSDCDVTVMIDGVLVIHEVDRSVVVERLVHLPAGDHKLTVGTTEPWRSEIVVDVHRCSDETAPWFTVTLQPWAGNASLSWAGHR